MSLVHACPGLCGRNVLNHLYACKPCWYRLPQDLRRPISDTYRRDPLAHLHAMGDARRWYLDHPAVSRG